MSTFEGVASIPAGAAVSDTPFRLNGAADNILLYIPAGTTGVVVPLVSTKTAALGDGSGGLFAPVASVAGTVVAVAVSALTLPCWVALPGIAGAAEVMIATKTTALPTTWADSNQAVARRFKLMSNG